MNAVLDADIATCRHCGKEMPPMHLICVFCHLDGKTHNHEDTENRIRRAVEAILWS